MKFWTMLIITLVPALSWGQGSTFPAGDAAGIAKKNFLKIAPSVQVNPIRELPVQSNGRIKPFDSLARETFLFVNGSRMPLGLDPVQFYLTYVTYEGSGLVEVIEIRNKTLREQLGFRRDKRYFSVAELEQTALETQARPLLSKAESNQRAMEPLEKDTVEAYHQYIIAKEIMSGEHFLAAIDFAILKDGAHGEEMNQNVVDMGRNYLTAVSRNDSKASENLAPELIAAVKAQTVPSLFEGYQSKIPLEVTYNHFHPFLIAGILYFCLGLSLFFGFLKKSSKLVLSLAYGIPMFIHLVGFATRIYITGFAPVTNMYTTMLWVSLGVALFSALLLVFYNVQRLVGVLLVGSGLVLLLQKAFR